MTKRFVLFIVIALAILLASQPAQAQGVPGTIYVDTAYTGTESGTSTQPYNELGEAINAARNLSGGAWIYEKQPNGSWRRTIYVSPVVSGPTGESLPMVTVYALLAVVALALAVVGLQLRRRSRQLQV